MTLRTRALAPALAAVLGTLLALPAAAEKIQASVVTITVQAGQGGDIGTGVVLDDAGHILTNEHVVSAAAGGAGQPARPGTRTAVAAAHPGVNSNVLTDESVIDPLSGNSVLNGIPVEIKPLVRS